MIGLGYVHAGGGSASASPALVMPGVIFFDFFAAQEWSIPGVVNTSEAPVSATVEIRACNAVEASETDYATIAIHTVDASGEVSSEPVVTCDTREGWLAFAVVHTANAEIPAQAAVVVRKIVTGGGAQVGAISVLVT